MNTTERFSTRKLLNHISALAVLLMPLTGVCQPHYVEIGTLPAPTAAERGEVFDPSTATLFSFIYWTHPGAGGNTKDVYSTKVGGEVFAWRQTTSSPSENYWGRGCADNGYLYFNGTIHSAAVSQYAPIGSDGLLGSWKTTTALPSVNGYRSLHQTFVFSNRLYVVGGWHLDGQPAYDDAYYAPIQSGGALGSFVRTTSLPEGVASHSTAVSADGKVYLVNKTNLYVAQIAGDGSIGTWAKQPGIEGLDHNNNGNTGMAVISNLLVIVDYTNTFLCRLKGSGHLDSVAARIANPDYLGERSVYVHQGKTYVTSTTGKMYRIDGVGELAGPPTNWVLSITENGYVSAPDPDSLAFPTNFTLEAWIQPSKTLPEPHDQAVISKNRDVGSSGYRLGLSGSKPEFAVVVGPSGSGSMVYLTSIESISPGTWYHLCGTYDGSVFCLYVDGLLKASARATFNIQPSSLPIYFGQAGLPGDVSTFFGRIDEIRIWNRARTAEEIYRDRSCELTGTESNLVAYWTFDNGTAKDVTGHGHDGACGGDAHTEPIGQADAVHAGTCGARLPNEVLALDGSGDFVSIPSADDLQNQDAITIEAWILPQHNTAISRFISKSDGQWVGSQCSYEVGYGLDNWGAGTNWIVNISFYVGTVDWGWLSAPVQENTWIHVAACYESGPGLLRLYTNGLLAAASDRNADGVTPLAGKLLRQTSLPLVFGTLPGVANTTARGQMDEIRIWNKARTAEEIYRDRYCRLTGSEPNLTAYYNFDDGTGKDLTGHGHDGAFVEDAHAEPVIGTDFVHAGLCGEVLPRFIIDDLTAGGGVVMSDPFFSSFPMNSAVTLTATPAAGWTFLDWMGDAQGTEAVTTLQMNRDKVVEARFGTSVTAVPFGAGTVSVIPASALYPYGTSVRVVAQPQPGSSFTGWSGSTSGDMNPLALIVRDGNPAIFASFAALPAYRWALTVIPDGFGRVSVTPRANSYTNGQTITLRALPEAGQDFLGWSGDTSGTGATNILTMNQSKVITANFTKRPSLRLQLLGSTDLLLSLNGEFNGAYSILASTDLARWSPFLTVTNSYGEAQAVDSRSSGQWRFYRAVAP